ncbi:MAG: DUF4097 domain-containing protein [Oscillospiraceae bacterium]|nr:DUF4097 domain-containing protein [Oscillospiraceae bacterium]
MRKIYIALIIIMLVTFSAAAVLLFVELTNVKLNYYTINKEQEITLEPNIQKIEINSKKAYSVVICTTYTKDVKVMLNGSYNSIMQTDIEVLFSTKNDVLTIDVAEKGFLKYVNLSSYSNNSLELVVYVPADFTHELDVNATAGELAIQDVNTSNINVTGAIVDFNSENIFCDVKVNGIIDSINMTYRELNSNVEISGISNKVNINVLKGSSYVVENTALGSKTNYYLDNNLNYNVKIIGSNKIILHGLNVELNVNEYTILKETTLLKSVNL